jgi:hypothetical protein
LRQLGSGVDRTAVQKWWAKAQRTGEEAYARAHVISSAKEATLKTPLLLIIETRYAKHLPDLYVEILEKRTDIESYDVASAIGRSALAREDKLALFHRGATHGQLRHQLPAIDQLRSLDPAGADSALLKIMPALPTKTKGAVWTSDEPRVAGLVKDSKNPEVWNALTVAAQRAHVSLRMELMDHLSESCTGEDQPRETLRFLAQFLDDETIRDRADDENLYEGPCAAFTFPRITVRDFASKEIANILDFPESPSPDWSPEEWSALRDKVVVATEQIRRNE